MDADAIVIGAGAAGLAAARSLAARSLRVVVVEARNRVGGRAWSHRLARGAVAAELGAEFIHGPAPETMALLREAGRAAVDTGGEFWERGDDGALQPRDGFGFTPIFEAARSLPADQTVDEFLGRYGNAASRREIADARAFVEGFDAADPAIASVRAIANELHSGVDSVSARPLGGYHALFDCLHNACVTAGVAIHLSSVVSKIAHHPGSVHVSVRSSWGTSRVFTAKAAIVTLPVGVLRQRGDDTEVVFEPHLPPEKQVALSRIEMGHVVRVALWFRSAFWERVENGRYRYAGFFRDPGQPFPTYWTQLPVRGELLVAWAGGPKAAALHDVTQAQRIALALEGCGALFGAPELTGEEFEAAVTHDWMRDPFARGAYSYVLVNGESARETLAAPIDDTVFFAGEATSDDGQGGTVNGALQSGERAARQVAASLGTEGIARG